MLRYISVYKNTYEDCPMLNVLGVTVVIKLIIKSKERRRNLDIILNQD